MKRPRGYIEWNPQQKTWVLLNAVYEVFEEYRKHLPLTVRQIYYRLVDKPGFSKTKSLSTQLTEHLVSARRSRKIPFTWIRDDGAVELRPYEIASPADFRHAVERLLDGSQIGRQAEQQQYIELWCEAAGMAPQLDRVARPYGVPVFSGGGYDSLTVKRQVVDRVLPRAVPTVILHVGDHDKHGKQIFTALAEDVTAFVEADDPRQEVTFETIAVTLGQIREHGLVSDPDNESKVQAEALPPDVLAQIVIDAIEARLDLRKYKTVLKREKRLHRELRKP